MDRHMLDQLRHLLRPLSNRIHNTVARVVVQLVNDGKKQQLVQVGVLADETIDDAEHFEPYGFTSVPLAGAEGVSVFPDGDRERAYVVVISDRRHRPIGGEPGEVTMYSHTGAKVKMLANGDIELQPAPGGEVLIRDEGGSVDRLVTLTEFNSHTHAVATTGTATAQSGTAAAPTPAATGTQRLRVQ